MHARTHICSCENVHRSTSKLFIVDSNSLAAYVCRNTPGNGPEDPIEVHIVHGAHMVHMMDAIRMVYMKCVTHLSPLIACMSRGVRL